MPLGKTTDIKEIYIFMGVYIYILYVLFVVMVDPFVLNNLSSQVHVCTFMCTYMHNFCVTLAVT